MKAFAKKEDRSASVEPVKNLIFKPGFFVLEANIMDHEYYRQSGLVFRHRFISDSAEKLNELRNFILDNIYVMGFDFTGIERKLWEVKE